MQDKKLIATDPAPGDDTLRTRLLPLSAQTRRLLRPINRAGLRRTNRCVEAAFGRLLEALFLLKSRRSGIDTTDCG